MTAHPIDTEALRASALEELEYAEPASTRWWILETIGVLDALDAAEHRATRAETRIKAVEDVLDDLEQQPPDQIGWDAAGLLPVFRRALDGDA